VFWIEEENGYHLINGHRIPLMPGDLFLIRPQDQHDLRAINKAGLRLVNVSFPADTIAFLQQRYFPHDRSFWGGKATLPTHYRLAPTRRRQLSIEADSLAMEPRVRINLERFLLNLLHILAIYPQQTDLTQIPSWLQTAIEKIRQPEHFIKGTPELARLADKTPEHVARLTRQWLRRTPTEIVNEARLDYAAGRLSMTTEPILDICMECGFDSLAHFYKIFKAHFRTSPRRYRLAQQILPK
jgi:AraC family cel operon transcriptional repressor